MEKHSRGLVARSDRESRIQEKDGKLDMRPQQLGSFTHLGRPTKQTRVALFSEPRIAATQPQQQTNTTKSDYHHQQPSQSFVEPMHPSNMERMYSGKLAFNATTIKLIATNIQILMGQEGYQIGLIIDSH
ncbi:hypothetical protein ACB092_05G014300 [Castanea dentata]